LSPSESEEIFAALDKIDRAEDGSTSSPWVPANAVGTAFGHTTLLPIDATRGVTAVMMVAVGVAVEAPGNTICRQT
jgi:hypothetical protein